MCVKPTSTYRGLHDAKPPTCAVNFFDLKSWCPIPGAQSRIKLGTSHRNENKTHQIRELLWELPARAHFLLHVSYGNAMSMLAGISPVEVEDSFEREWTWEGTVASGGEEGMLVCPLVVRVDTWRR